MNTSVAWTSTIHTNRTNDNNHDDNNDGDNNSDNDNNNDNNDDNNGNDADNNKQIRFFCVLYVWAFGASREPYGPSERAAKHSKLRVARHPSKRTA